MARHWRRDDEEALDISCPICHVGPGDWCVYVGNSLRAGQETQRLHIQRTHELWLRRPVVAPKRYRMTPAIWSLEAFDRAQERTLREWLRQFSYLLTELT
jgi:hypothetical protein